MLHVAPTAPAMRTLATTCLPLASPNAATSCDCFCVKFDACKPKTRGHLREAHNQIIKCIPFPTVRQSTHPSPAHQARFGCVSGKRRHRCRSSILDDAAVECGLFRFRSRPGMIRSDPPYVFTIARAPSGNMKTSFISKSRVPGVL